MCASSGDYNQPMSYNRWNYTYSNPVNLKDPSGKFPADCLESGNFKECIRVWLSHDCPEISKNDLETSQREYIKSFGLILEPEEKWTGTWLTNLYNVLFFHIGAIDLPRWLNHKSATLFIDKEGPAICSDGEENCYSGSTGPDKITFYHTGTSINSEINMLHEFGHLVDNLSDSDNDFTNRLRSHTFTINVGKYWAGWNGSKYASIPEEGPNNVYQVGVKRIPIGGDEAWQQLKASAYTYPGHEQGEDWADIFANGILHNINTATEPGGQMYDFFKEMERYALSR
jgi:hypothetical protein